MKILTVENFSCIKKASVDFSRLTIFIGPQASGKSVLCKLTYFFVEAALLQSEAILKKNSYEKFCEHIKTRFFEWFPASAWGKEKFKIQYKCGDYSISLVRKTYAQTVSDDFRLQLSAEFKSQYETLLRETQKVEVDEKHESLPESFRLEWRLINASRESLKKLMQEDFTSNQTFVPAGRSFFTSIGKAIAAFEQGRVLDPLILRFGRQYTAYKNEVQYFRESKTDLQFKLQFREQLNEIFGGKLQQDGELEYVITDDGRTIPISALSSGQQELLPLLAVLPNLIRSEPGLCYIEEPEAHLFPSAQSKLIEAIVMMLTASTSNVSVVLTTHSPYVLAKVNNLIKAGSLGRRRSQTLKRKVESIVPSHAWLDGKSVKAYAIKNGVVESILEADDLINAEYLDNVSGDIGREFSELLELEVFNA
jgi:predicted ATPase